MISKDPITHFFFQNNTKLLLTKAIQGHIFIHYSLIIQGRNPIISKLTRCYTRGCKNAGFRPGFRRT